MSFHSNGPIVAKISRSNESQEITDCWIFNVEDDSDKVVDIIRKEKLRYTPVLEMISLVEECRQVNMNASPHIHSEKSELVYDLFELIRDLKRGFIPGTNWCGFGTRAKNYFQLGPRGKVDSCCRAHDLCPYTVPPLATRFGFRNDALYTKSLCLCDERFHSCLKKAKSPLGDILGFAYFNVFQFQCLKFQKEPGPPYKMFIEKSPNPPRKYKITHRSNVKLESSRRVLHAF